ncbi:MAG: FkbM family methyltransferase [Phycisphaerae bacterium]
MNKSKRSRSVRHHDKGGGLSASFKRTFKENGRPTIEISMDNMPQFLVRAKNAIDTGQIDEAVGLLNDRAIETIDEAVKRDPARTDITLVLATVLCDTKQFQKAEQWYKKLLGLGLDEFVYNRLGYICECTGRRNEAIKWLEKGMEANPDDSNTICNLGMNLVHAGQKQRGIELLREAVDKSPGDSVLGSNLLVHLHYLPQIDSLTLFEEHKRWGKTHAPLDKARKSHDNTPEPDRRLRIGYISPDFREHSVTYFFESILDGYNRQAVEVYGFGSVAASDKITERLKGKFDHYRNIYGLDDEKVASMIERDKIDILVDLAGHTAGNRLSVLARRPAPIQVTYLGYPDTTGMEAVNYRLTDALADTSDAQQFYSEELVFLPKGFLCYRPDDFAPAATPLPFLRNGYITFGSFNNSCKINPFIIKLWAEILKVNDNSRLILKSIGTGGEEIKKDYLRQFEQLGIGPDRVEIRGPKSKIEHLKTYGQIDIALDTYPYNGTTTTCEALWMGAPVISLTGKPHISRVGLSILSQAGLGFFSASTPEEYIAKASALAAKPEALAKIRTSMRQRMLASWLCNTKAFAGSVEEAYRKMWHRWCESKNADATGRQRSLRIQERQSALGGAGLTTELIIKADNFNRTGHRQGAVESAIEGYYHLHHGKKADNVPNEILARWNVPDAESFFLHLLMSSLCFSSYYNIPAYKEMFSKWKELEPSNPEAYLKLGLLLALESRAKGKAAPADSLKALRHANKIMQDERSAAALALVQGGINELKLSYDKGHIYAYPDLMNITTYTLLEQGDWFEHDDLNLFRKLIRPDDKVLDMGANVGVYAISAAHRTSGQGRVVAIEPAGETFELLNKSANGFTKMTAVHGAISDKSGVGSLAHGASSELHKLGTGGNGEKVDIFSVDDLALKTGVDRFDIIKMDVEGHEQQAIAGAKKIMVEGSPIIFYEIKEGTGYHFALMDVFRDLGYDSYYYVEGLSSLVKFHKGQKLDSYVLNMVAVRPESLGRFDNVANITTDPAELLTFSIRQSPS